MEEGGAETEIVLILDRVLAARYRCIRDALRLLLMPS